MQFEIKFQFTMGIKNALFGMALGLYRLHVIFFQSKWETIGKMVCDVKFEIYNNPSKIKDINEIMLELIPKVGFPKFLK